MKTLIKAVVVAAALTTTASFAQQSEGQIHIVVPYTPGGIVDTTTRILAHQLEHQLGQAVVVDNVPGAGGQIGSARVVRSKPDGRTLLMSGNGIAYRQLLVDVPYDSMTQLEPISEIVSGPTVLVVNPKVPVHTLAEVLKYAKSHPFSMGNSGTYGPTSLTAEILASATGAPFTQVPYRGDSAAIADAVGGSVQASLSALSATKAYIDAGKLRPIVVFDTKRAPAIPSVPTIGEAGYPKVIGNVWVSLLAPAGIPKATVARLSAAISASCADAETRKKLSASGNTVVCGSPEQLGRILKDDYERVREHVAQQKGKK